MKDSLTRALAGYRAQFSAFTAGQKVVAIVGTAALLLGGFMVYRWASAPTYAPLYANLSSADASAITQELDSTGVPYQLSDGGNTILVPQDALYQARLDVAGKGLPSSSKAGTDPFANSGIASSDFEQQTNVRMALESDLATTIEHIQGISTAVVHLAIPQKQAFSDNQSPTTASVLVQTDPGASLTPGQVQTIVQLVSSSVDGLDPKNVSVADSTGRVYTNPGADGSDPMMQDQQVAAVQNDLQTKLQAMLDRVVGPGNSTVQVTPVLDFDKKVTDITSYTPDSKNPVSSQTTSEEKYQGPGAANAAGGVVGPDGQLLGANAAGSSASKYDKKATTQDRAIGSTVQRVESTPGQIKSLHIGVAMDAAATKNVPLASIQKLIASTAGVNVPRGDTIQVAQVPFDRSAEAAAQQELQAAQAAQSSASRNDLIRKGALAGVVLLALLLALIKSRKRAKARAEATTYLVEQLREQAAQQQVLEQSNALALEAAEHTPEDDMRDELSALIERQPEDVASLLRGWLTER
ncbi:flagellar M-ring protein FliF [Nocardioides sp. TRM66260-LWL]|uniref:flagellar basal-body MS-ring/collar protein FliF n=1 Tax=Nocardioides sp. TRM66260-LWL TaxID=2874478 RepID=UPI001CC3733F|nr:flagellar basal-body MS-ring/collar protein FliF [Nocardioides sp. TRM66260-LWL]MBZ5735179.1 flagellar M-ring protein FliF [Nocardioides sp. TRM66260-LWL]